MKPETHRQSLIEERARHNSRALLWLSVLALLASILLLLQHLFMPLETFKAQPQMCNAYTAVYIAGLAAAFMALGLSVYLLSRPAVGWYNYLILGFAVFFMIELAALAVFDSGNHTDVSAYIIGIMMFAGFFRVRPRAALVIIIGISLSLYLAHWFMWGLLNLVYTLTVFFVTVLGGGISLSLETQRTDYFWVHRELDLQNKKLVELNSTDPLTGVMNRRSLLQVLYVYLEEFRRYNTPVSLVMVDIDYFKPVNDTHGHQVGDQVLIEFARLLDDSLRATDRLARYGGEEFIVILPHLHGKEACDAAERLRRNVMTTHFSDQKLQITASFGVAELTPEIPGINSLIKRADDALYSAKHQGRNRVVVFE
ncbi:MAG: GGDEF domain-containing protein [Spirochaetia bacterium]